MKDYEEFNAQDARLVILKALAGDLNYSMNENILDAVLASFGYARSRDWIRTQLRKLDELGAITTVEAGSVIVATITRNGLDHVEMRSIIEGVRRPSPGA